ncbi:Mrp/NBP35 family ATP-binding protein [Citricoccus sp.]|uniref:Mrp/NBP35 family ATP-binding protein n=1 Tax=Citricoccus sp. TaxID=1978372 RepID=UPI0028BED5E0|nr:Mrp/NBP35 family ATP-binding protein [Citricoccus sp.]
MTDTPDAPGSFDGPGTFDTPALTTDLERAAWARLGSVLDPEIRRPVTELGMVASITESAEPTGPPTGAPGAGHLTIGIRLTIAGCPLRDTITQDVERALEGLDGCTGVEVVMAVMTAEQRASLKDLLTAGRPKNQFEKGSLARVYAVASGKGGVGKSTVTANLATALADRGLSVGLVDADIHGFSIPGLLGTTAKPTRVDEMILPPVAQGVKVISIGMFLDADRPVAWRGPMLHRALEQFVTDVYWGDLDVLLVDLPPGTGDIAISAAQLLPTSELLIVTTPQQAAAQVAARAGELAEQTGQQVAGVIENMAAMTLPDGTVLDLFGSGGGQTVADRLTGSLGHEVPLLGSVPLDPLLREDGDGGTPVVLEHPDSAAGTELRRIAGALAVRPRGLAGLKLPVTPRD